MVALAPRGKGLPAPSSTVSLYGSAPIKLVEPQDHVGMTIGRFGSGEEKTRHVHTHEVYLNLLAIIPTDIILNPYRVSVHPFLLSVHFSYKQ